MRSLYDASLGPTLSSQTYTISQLDLMPKSWNEIELGLLRHWRSGLLTISCCIPEIRDHLSKL